MLGLKKVAEVSLHAMSDIYHCASYMPLLSCFSHVQLFATQWTTNCQAPLSIEFTRQEYWGGLPCPAPGDLPKPGIELTSFMSPALAVGSLSLAPLGSPCLLYASIHSSSYSHSIFMHLDIC